MQEKLIVPYPVIVEGKYDKIKLSSIIEAQIIPTAGFGVFKNRELSQLLRKLSQKSMIIVLTDSDGGGKVIRSHISSLIPKAPIPISPKSVFCCMLWSCWYLLPYLTINSRTLSSFALSSNICSLSKLSKQSNAPARMQL